MPSRLTPCQASKINIYLLDCIDARWGVEGLPLGAGRAAHADFTAGHCDTILGGLRQVLAFIAN